MPCPHIFARASSSFAGRSFPLVFGQSLGRADVDQRLQRVLHDGFGQALGRIVRAAAASVSPGRNEDTARCDDDRVIHVIEPHQSCERLHPLPQV